MVEGENWGALDGHWLWGVLLWGCDAASTHTTLVHAAAGAAAAGGGAGAAAGLSGAELTRAREEHDLQALWLVASTCTHHEPYTGRGRVREWRREGQTR